MSSTAPCEICGGATGPWRLDDRGTLDRCGDCGHLRRDLDAAPADHRDLAYGGEPTLDRIRLDLTYRTMRRVCPAPASVFEVGFGAGSMLRRFLDDGAEIAGTDPDQLGIDVDPLVRTRGRLFDIGVEDVPVADVAADLVYGIHVLEHVVDPVRTVQVCRELVAPGGQVQFLTPAGDSSGLRRYGSAWWMLEDPTHVRFFTEESARRALTDAGFVDVEVHRPVLDSITTDVGSVTRRVRPGHRAHGVLGSKAVLAAGVVTAPAVILGRAVRPADRPTLHVVARRPR